MQGRWESVKLFYGLILHRSCLDPGRRQALDLMAGGAEAEAAETRLEATETRVEAEAQAATADVKVEAVAFLTSHS